MRTHKKQHFVPRSYLKAWCDPATPAGQEPYVWRFSKDGSESRPKAPEKIFRETDLYTIPLPGGGRDLVLEHGLSGLEGTFVRIRDGILARRKEPTAAQRMVLCAFIAAAQARTPTQRDHVGGHWAKVLEMMDRMKEQVETATPEQRRRIAMPGGGSSGPRFSYEDVKRMAEQPMQTMLRPQITASTPLLARLDLAILECSGGNTFITSDNPCVWYDPEGHKRPPFYQAPALMYDTIEITMPVSPRLLIVLNRKGRSGYFAAGERAADEYNRRTRAHCAEYFVNSSSSAKAIWFDLGQEPADSWRKQHPAS